MFLAATVRSRHCSLVPISDFALHQYHRSPRHHNRRALLVAGTGLSGGCAGVQQDIPRVIVGSRLIDGKVTSIAFGPAWITTSRDGSVIASPCAVDSSIASPARRMDIVEDPLSQSLSVMRSPSGRSQVISSKLSGVAGRPRKNLRRRSRGDVVRI
jgi:hypothetical protein